MGTPSPFEVSRAIGNNLSGSIRRVKDENAIESILSQATQSGDPRVVQDTIGKILSQVSPERQPQAIKYLENVYGNIQENKKLERENELKNRQRTAAQKFGVDSDLPPALQTEVYKQNAKNERINSVYGQPNQQLPSQQKQSVTDEPSNANEMDNTTLRALSDDKLVRYSGHPDKEISEPAKAELRRREAVNKEERQDLRDLRKETLPLKQDIIQRADAARESIRNKNHLIDIIDRGNLDDPTYAVLAESLPLNLGKRLLSNDTVEYKGGLVDEFSDLKNIFKGATRVKEVEIYENKLADLYLTDSQKKAILKSRINGSKAELIREKAAQEVEEKFPNITALKFNKKVDELAKPEMDKLFNSVWDEQKSILDQAESRKEVALDPNDPEDYKIMQAILKEAGGTTDKARALAKKKGYKVVGQK